MRLTACSYTWCIYFRLIACRLSTSISPRSRNFPSANHNILAVSYADCFSVLARRSIMSTPLSTFHAAFSATFFRLNCRLSSRSEFQRHHKLFIFSSPFTELDFTIRGFAVYISQDDVVQCDVAPSATDRMQLHLLQILLLSAWRFSTSLSPRCSNFASANQNILAVFNADSFRSDCRRSAFSSLFHRTAPNFSTFHTTTRLHSIRSQTPRSSAHFSFLSFHLLTNLTSHYELSHRTRSRRSVPVCSRCD
jgi:hypothetical protein